MHKNTQTTIIGSGILASICAIAFKRNGITFDWYGSMPQNNDAMCYALHHKSICFLNQHQIFPTFNHIEEMILHHDCISYDLHAKHSENPYLCSITQHNQLTHALYQNLSELDINAIPIQNQDYKNNTLIINSHAIKTPYIIAVDGPKSPIRRLIKAQQKHTQYEHHAHIAILTHYESNKAVQQIFSNEGTFAILPISKHNSSLIWSCNPEQHKRILSNGIKHEISKILSILGLTLTCIQHHQYLPIQSSLTPSFTHQNIAFAGSSLHTVHPLAGLGLNLGINDLDTLKDLIINHKPLIRYKTKRIPPHTFAQHLTHMGYLSTKNPSLLKSLFKVMHHTRHPAAKSMILKATQLFC
ncbi:FAD-dependent monooxygenase [Candidatus Comchoanobacter bicostacola]|uniref:FAD-dependent monooxygenase n=1 Tax=Candidatus Comchoanobacter bicostacola TaxID=2919598 RepID=A0ABY5DLK9_9GAMM|nr:FAD-dependent monooxygenase [Candidatus Comchoanobacter bicostacola]UTC24652.1 FAD-dependent monooxygenase [Candidatus Comchoanobacter bicostacola]